MRGWSNSAERCGSVPRFPSPRTDEGDMLPNITVTCGDCKGKGCGNCDGTGTITIVED
ncbi:hypothetical protein GTS_10790 [Gandjariella thermophila]|uniref:Uncharacterized protein n=1 Tax=Gandjariella thermophila TaxID=1931992 RepID=A0A4D4J4I8_9PSEU|nr:hypothetical protein GTS_10790 [Gandjariella thermophila]